MKILKNMIETCGFVCSKLPVKMFLQLTVLACQLAIERASAAVRHLVKVTFVPRMIEIS